MEANNQGTQREIIKNFMRQTGVVSLSARTGLLLWPINFCHESNCNQNNCDSLKCKIYPIAPSINVRDVGDSRLHDELRIDLINGTTIDAIFGSILHKDEINGCVSTLSMFRMNSIFDRYADNNGDLYFTDDMDTATLISKARKLTRTLDYTGSELCRTKFKDELKNLSNSDHSSVLGKFLLHLDLLFHNFKSKDGYKTLNEALIAMDENLEVPQCVLRGSLELQATFRFQKFMYPSCLVFMNGNHRHARLLLRMLGCHRAQSQELSETPLVNANLLTHCFTFKTGSNGSPIWIDNAITDGYMITETSDGLGSVSPYAAVITMTYKFYVPNKNKKLHELSLREFQSICRQANNVLYHSVQEEAYHGIIQKCHDSLSRLKATSKDISKEMKQYLAEFVVSTSSDKHNSTRNNKNDGPTPYINMRMTKQLQRDMIAATFFPHLQISTSYVQGKTYIEKINTKNKLKNVFEGDTPHESSKLLQVFILLDNIYIPDNILSFIKMIRNTYNKMHLDSSSYHHISHTELWNSHTVLEDMNKFILETIRIMKSKGTILEIRKFNSLLDALYNEDDAERDSANEENNDGPEQRLDEDKGQKEQKKKKKKEETDEMSLFHFKITHCCQQYAFFVALTIANMIGLYPIIPGCRLPDCSGDDQEKISMFNVFRLLLDALLWKGEYPEVDVRYLYMEFVVNDFFSSLFYNTNWDDRKEEHVTFPFTFQEFCDQNCHINVITFFYNMINNYPEETQNFYSKNKKGKTQ